MPYMNVTEVESALIGLAAAHSSICELITLPNVSVEGRTSHAVRLGTKFANTVDAYYLTGGMHAREWGSCKILVNLAVDLCDAYAAGSGVGYGGKYFSKAQVRAALENMSILIFPCVNPDGRSYSQNRSALWRKNRNPVDFRGVASKVGIDTNRNQDFLWDFKTAFDSRPSPTLFADCTTTQESSDTAFNGRPNGAFTYNLLNQLKAHLDDTTVQGIVNATDTAMANSCQTPQLRGNPTTFGECFLGGSTGSVTVAAGGATPRYIGDIKDMQMAPTIGAQSTPAEQVIAVATHAKKTFGVGRSQIYIMSKADDPAPRLPVGQSQIPWGTDCHLIWTAFRLIMRHLRCLEFTYSYVSSPTE